MKKVFCILSILTIVSPVFAEDATPTPVAGEPTHADPATESSAQPGYALVNSHTNDSKAASAGYVKGAYNAAIKAVNTVASMVSTVPVNSGNSSTRANIWVE